MAQIRTCEQVGRDIVARVQRWMPEARLIINEPPVASTVNGGVTLYVQERTGRGVLNFTLEVDFSSGVYVCRTSVGASERFQNFAQQAVTLEVENSFKTNVHLFPTQMRKDPVRKLFHYSFG
jgi:hypothetical protein